MSPLLFALACGPLPPPVTGDPPPYTLASAEVVTEDGGRVDVSPDGALLAFDRRNADGDWDLWVMGTDGSDEECLTCDGLGLDRGQPAWSPDGEWLVYQSESADHPDDGSATHPGAGIYNDLVAMRWSDREVFVLNDVRDGADEERGGTLHPVFSHGLGAGGHPKLLWTDHEGGCWTCVVGDWQIALAEFVVSDWVPTLANREDHNPGIEGEWYETHGFGPEDEWIYFSAATEGQWVLAADLVRMDLATGAYSRLTQTGGARIDEFSAYDEHAKLSPGGDAFQWLNDESGDSELWLMGVDGGGRFQVTTFNTAGSAHAALVGDLRSVPSDNAWDPAAPAGTATSFVFVQVDFHLLSNDATSNYIIRLDYAVD